MELTRTRPTKLTDAVRGINACAGSSFKKLIALHSLFILLLIVPNLSIAKMMPNSPPSPTYSTYSAPPLGHFTYTRPTLQAPQHAKARQTILSRPNGIPRMSVAMNQGNFVDTPDMNGPQISGSQLSIRPRVNHALGNGYGCSSVLAIPFTDKSHLDQ